MRARHKTTAQLREGSALPHLSGRRLYHRLLEGDSPRRGRDLGKDAEDETFPGSWFQPGRWTVGLRTGNGVLKQNLQRFPSMLMALAGDRPPVNLLLTGASFPNFSCSAGDYTKLSLLPQILSDAPLGPSITIGRLTAIFLLGCRLGALNSENYDPNWRSPLVFLPRSSGRVS